MLKRILVGLGGTEYANSAINHGIALAIAHGAELTGVSVIDKARLENVGPVPMGGGHYAKKMAENRIAKAEQHVEWSLGRFTEACLAAGVKYNVMREVGEPFTLMNDQARYHDLMIFGLRSLFEFDLIPDPHDTLVRMVQAGVRPILAVAENFQQIKKVLIAYSGSMESAKAMKHFVQMQVFKDIEVRLISFEDGGRHAAQLLENAAEYCRAHELKVEIDCLTGNPREQLLPYAEKYGADLTVIGNSAKNLLLRRIFGETALHAIRNANRPLFLAQ